MSVTRTINVHPRRHRFAVAGRSGVAALLATTAAFLLAPAAASAQAPGAIAFTSFKGDAARVFAVNPDGTSVRPLAQTPGSAFEGSPAYSPDGSRIVYTCGNFELCLMNADGSAQTRLTVNDWPRELRYDTSPAWSPDGTTIAFVRTVGGQDEIWLVAPDGSGLRKLPVPAGVNGSPSFAADSRTIAFAHAEDETDSGDDIRSSSDSAVHVIGIDGSGLRKLSGKGVNASEPAWSPDGTRIAFTRTFDEDEAQIFVMNADGSSPRRLTSRTSSAAAATWSPDSARIAFSSVRASGVSLYHVAATGGRAVRLTTGAGPDLEPAWQPAGASTPAGQAVPPAVAPSVATPDARVVGVLMRAFSGLLPAVSALVERRAAALLSAGRNMERHARRITTAARALRPTSPRARRVRRTVLESMSVLERLGTATRALSRTVRRGDRSAAREQRGGIAFALVFGVALPLGAGSGEAGISQTTL